MVCVVLGLALAAVSGFRALREQASTRADLIGAAVLEVAVLGYVVVRVVDLIGGHRTSGLAILIIYLFAIVLTTPIAAALSYAEPSRWGAIVLGVGALVVCVLLARIAQLWTPVG